MDWNWFFSSFCQSAAALIGIIGAFVISRLLGINEKISNIISEFDNLLIEYKEAILNIKSRRFYWFTKINVKYNETLKQQIEDEEFENLNEEQILKKVYDLDDRLYKIDEAVMESFNYLYEKHKPVFISLGNSKMKQRNFPSINITPTNVWSDLETEKQLIDQLNIKSHILIQKFTKNSQDLKSFDISLNSLKNIIFLLLIAFPLTVIYPLHFMPMKPNEAPEILINISDIFTIKATLLIIFLITIEGLFYYFLLIIKGLKKSLKEVKTSNSDDLKDIKKYSIYFE